MGLTYIMRIEGYIYHDEERFENNNICIFGNIGVNGYKYILCQLQN